MKKIPLTQGKFALVDDKDFERVNQYKWHTYYGGNGRWYAAGRINGEKISMHRFILGLKKGGGWITDHIDDNGLNNQENNLRKCTAQQNRVNARKSKKRVCSSKYLGVSYFAPDCKISNEEIPKIKWSAAICINGKSKHLGYFNTEEQAALAYDLAAKEHFGEFARLNIL